MFRPFWYWRDAKDNLVSRLAGNIAAVIHSENSGGVNIDFEEPQNRVRSRPVEFMRVLHQLGLGVLLTVICAQEAAAPRSLSRIQT